ncbi:M23 family metallopeptidase [Candidatus Falkowbacteria bacterium]|nr:M23 family metallopeptidase [Candidatus Falkowbacteria bacterium]
MKNLILKSPLKNVWITQIFGVDWTGGLLPLGNGKTGSYKDLGLSNHNGIDLKAPTGTEVLAAHDGIVLIDEVRGGYGNSIMLRTSDRLYDTIYGHLKESKVYVGQSVKTGDVIALSNNTGISTGPHLHFGLRPVNYDGNNGYFGWIDPEPFMEKGWDNLPVDTKYGRTKNWLAEFNMRFKNSWLQRHMLKKYYRRPPLLNSRETNALVYGGWGADEVLNDANRFNWYFLTKGEYLAGKKPPLTI